MAFRRGQTLHFENCTVWPRRNAQNGCTTTESHKCGILSMRNARFRTKLRLASTKRAKWMQGRRKPQMWPIASHQWGREEAQAPNPTTLSDSRLDGLGVCGLASPWSLTWIYWFGWGRPDTHNNHAYFPTKRTEAGREALALSSSLWFLIVELPGCHGLLPGGSHTRQDYKRAFWPRRNGTFDACGWPSWLCAFRMGETLAVFNLACLVLSSMLSWGTECEHLTIQIKRGHHAKRENHRSEVSGVAWARWPCHPAKPAGNCTRSVCAFLGERVRTPDHTNQARTPHQKTVRTPDHTNQARTPHQTNPTRPSRQA